MKLSIRQKLRVYLNPANWVRCYRTSPSLSREINALLDTNEEILIINEYVTKLGPHYLWTENYPYAYGFIYKEVKYGLPDRLTVYRLHKAIQDRGIMAPEDYVQNMHYQPCEKVTIQRVSEGWLLFANAYPTKYVDNWQDLIGSLEELFPHE
jgi:hypothetical protein